MSVPYWYKYSLAACLGTVIRGVAPFLGRLLLTPFHAFYGRLRFEDYSNVFNKMLLGNDRDKNVFSIQVVLRSDTFDIHKGKVLERKNFQYNSM